MSSARSRHVIHAPLGELGVRTAPLHKAAEALNDGFALVEVLLRQTGDFGDVVLQAAEDAGTQVDGEGIQHVGVVYHLFIPDRYFLWFPAIPIFFYLFACSSP